MLLGLSRQHLLRQVGEEFSCDVSLEAAHGFDRGELLVGPAFDVGLRSWVAAHARHDDAPERAIGVAVSAAVESVPVLSLPAGGGDGCDSAEPGERGFAAQPVGVVAGRDKDRSGCVGSDAVVTQQCCATKGLRMRSSSSISDSSSSTRRASRRSDALVAEVTSKVADGRSPAQVRTSSTWVR
jgi:hypothetical protein